MKAVIRHGWFAAALIAAASLVACGGNANRTLGNSGGSGITPDAQIRGAVAVETASQGAQKKARGKAQFVIRIPHKLWKITPIAIGRPAHRRGPKYISASTQSMSVAVTGVPTQTFNLTPTSPGCTSSGGSTSCSETAFLPTGQQTITITLYDQTGGQGNPLSTASTTATIASGTTTQIPIVLDGVPATAAVFVGASPSPTLSIPQGTPTSVPVMVTAYDADHNVIMTPGAYSSPVTLADSDSSGATTLSTSSVSAPGASITLAYNGGVVSSATLTPSINGAAQSSGAATLMFTTAQPTISEYTVPTSNSAPGGLAGGIISGSDSALWFTECNGNKIGRITTLGAIAEYSVPTNSSSPFDIASGSDGALWFTEYAGNKIGRITTLGAIAEYSVPTPNGSPFGIASGPDGALWFTECNGNKIGRITTLGAVTEYAVPTSNSDPQGIAPGPDGALWFAEQNGNKIGRITTLGAITEYSVPTADSSPWDIAAGPDGALWFTEYAQNKIGRITTLGAIVEYSVPTHNSDLVGSYPLGIASGPDGALWFAETCGGSIGRITTLGAITEYSVPTLNSLPNGIAAGPDDALWFTEYAGNKIGRITALVSPSARRKRISTEKSRTALQQLRMIGQTEDGH